MGRESRYNVYVQLLLVVLELVPQDYEVNGECLTLLMRRLRRGWRNRRGTFCSSRSSAAGFSLGLKYREPRLTSGVL